jgi:phosphomannomutase
MLILFDIDGTLTPAMGTIDSDMIEALADARRSGWSIGVVGGSDRDKAVRQLGDYVLNDLMDIAFHENGCTVYKKNVLVHADRMEDFIAEEDLNSLISFILALLSTTECPWRTGTFIERRKCMLNISPIGRACSQSQRDAFFEWDQKTGCRADLADTIREQFLDLPIEIEIGGQISLDIFPRGLDKRRCLFHLSNHVDDIHFIGDRCDPGGNDHHLYHDPRVIGHKTDGPEDTRRIIQKIIKSSTK